jgi:UDP-GlcNAc:undecaprenyl-phosphate GlcNAc-1-phosphate transferase
MIALPFLVAFACGLVLTPAMRRLAFRLDLLDRPDSARRQHTQPTPLLGGVAIAAAVVAASLVFAPCTLDLGIMLCAGLVMCVTGVVDDWRGLPASAKAGVQLAVAAVLFAVGVRVELHWLPAWLNALLSIGWLVGITNAVNLLDNMDGITSGVAGIASAFLALMAIASGQTALAVTAAAVTGACAAFLFSNRHPARIFMGDAGSLFLGMLLAVLGVRVRFENTTDLVTWMAPLLVFCVPLFDTLLVVISRARRRSNPFTTAGRDHTSHRLMRLGLGAHSVAMVHYLAGCLGGVCAVLVTRLSVPAAFAVGIAAALLWTSGVVILLRATPPVDP